MLFDKHWKEIMFSLSESSSFNYFSNTYVYKLLVYSNFGFQNTYISIAYHLSIDYWDNIQEKKDFAVM